MYGFKCKQHEAIHLIPVIHIQKAFDKIICWTQILIIYEYLWMEN